MVQNYTQSAHGVMKTGNAILFGIGIAVMAILCFFSFKYGKTKGETDCSVLIAQIDSLTNLPPRVVTDTFIIHPDPEIKWRKTIVHDTVRIKEEPHIVMDSIVNDEVGIWVYDWISGEILNRGFGYELYVPKEITIRDSIFINFPVPVDRIVYTNRNGIYLGASSVGGNQFSYSIDAAYAKNRHLFNVSYLRFGGTNNWMVGYKYLIYQKK